VRVSTHTYVPLELLEHSFEFTKNIKQSKIKPIKQKYPKLNNVVATVPTSKPVPS
jgi:hypothetical protein